MKASIDPKLLQALKGGISPLNVFAKFQATTGAGSSSPADVVTRVIRRTKQQAQYQFRDLDSVLHVNANSKFIEELIRQPEIVKASIAPQYVSALIPPINQRDVPASAISEPAFKNRT